jgi:small subunit ribosomal protein S23
MPKGTFQTLKCPWNDRRLTQTSVIQRQMYLMREKKIPRVQAYDIARKEFYAYRHQQEVSQRVAREEALHVGAYFGASVQDIGAKLEDQTYEKWKAAALKRGREIQQQQAANSMLDNAASLSSAEPEENEQQAMDALYGESADPASLNAPDAIGEGATGNVPPPPETVNATVGQRAFR